MTIGAVHLYLWEGDILVLYAIMGFFLIPLRRVPDSRLLRASAALVLAPSSLLPIVASGGRLDRERHSTALASRFSSRTVSLPTRSPIRFCATQAGWRTALSVERRVLSLRRFADDGAPVQGAGDVRARPVCRTIGPLDEPDALDTDTAQGPKMGVRHRTTGRAGAGGVPHWRNGQQPVAQVRRVARLRARGRAACDWICDDVCHPVAIEHVAREAFAARARRTPGADELLVADRVCAGGVLRNRAWADGPRRPGLVAAHCPRRHHHPAGLQPMVAGAFCVRATGVALAAATYGRRLSIRRQRV